MERSNITIKTEHLFAIKKLVQHSTLFDCPEDYIDHILDEILSLSEKKASPDQSKILEERLRDLGYL